MDGDVGINETQDCCGTIGCDEEQERQTEIGISGHHFDMLKCLPLILPDKFKL